MSKTLDVTKLKPGQNLTLTVDKLPRTDDLNSTIARLMRMDPANKKSLRRAQRMRRQRMIVYNRGNRDWVSREKSAKVVRVAAGATWTVPFTFDVVHELTMVQPYVSIKATK